MYHLVSSLAYFQPPIYGPKNGGWKWAEDTTMYHLSPSFEYLDMTHGFKGARLSGQTSSLGIMCID